MSIEPAVNELVDVDDWNYARSAAGKATPIRFAIRATPVLLRGVPQRFARRASVACHKHPGDLERLREQCPVRSHKADDGPDCDIGGEWVRHDRRPDGVELARHAVDHLCAIAPSDED